MKISRFNIIVMTFIFSIALVIRDGQCCNEHYSMYWESIYCEDFETIYKKIGT